MKYKFIFAIACILHFLLLCCFGISFFTTTILFYGCIYFFSLFLIRLIKNDKLSKIVKYNLFILFSLLLLTEFTLTFVFKKMNNYMENERGVYFSEYMRDKQVTVFKLLGLKPPVNTWENGAKPFQFFFMKLWILNLPLNTMQ